jgi:L-amino acid N-acyltransferase YncA
MNNRIIIRDFVENDIEPVLGIFNYFAGHSFAVYSEYPITIAHFKKMLDQVRTALVIQEEEKIIGFGYISNFKPFPNFNSTGLLTYFILPEYTGQGIGTTLFTELLSKGKQIGITNYLAHISSKNKQSIQFHKKLGFEEVGLFKNVATKFNEPFDMVWVQKQFND